MLTYQAVEVWRDSDSPQCLALPQSSLPRKQVSKKRQWWLGIENRKKEFWNFDFRGYRWFVFGLRKVRWKPEARNCLHCPIFYLVRWLRPVLHCRHRPRLRYQMDEYIYMLPAISTVQDDSHQDLATCIEAASHLSNYSCQVLH